MPIVHRRAPRSKKCLETINGRRSEVRTRRLRLRYSDGPSALFSEQQQGQVQNPEGSTGIHGQSAGSTPGCGLRGHKTGHASLRHAHPPGAELPELFGCQHQVTTFMTSATSHRWFQIERFGPRHAKLHA